MAVLPLQPAGLPSAVPPPAVTGKAGQPWQFPRPPLRTLFWLLVIIVLAGGGALRYWPTRFQPLTVQVAPAAGPLSSQLTPGPVMTAATFAGYLVAGPWGAVICTIAIYLPSFLLVQLAAPPLMRHRASPLVEGFVKGVYAAAICAILASVILLGGRAIGDWVTAMIAVAGLAALLRFHISGLLLVGSAAAVGLVAFQFLHLG
jgi:Chromate transporter